MAPKGRAPRPEANPASLLTGKDYKDSVNELFSTTALQQRDIDQKAVQLLDAYQKAGKAEESCQHLKTNLEGITREKVQNWRAYVYSLLRAFDSEVYNAMKEKSGGSRRSQKPKAMAGGLNPKAVDFQPGVWWQGDANTGAFAPQMPAYPMNMTSSQMMMGGGYPETNQQTGAASPPPAPQKAAEVPKDGAAEAAEAPKAGAAEAAEAPKAGAAEAPAPDKPAEATVPEGDKAAANADKAEAR